LQNLESGIFEQVIGEYQRSRQLDDQEIVISIDEKTLRGTIIGKGSRGQHLLTAYLPSSGLVLMQIAVESKENEIVAAPKLLQSIDLQGMIVIGDAIHTQRLSRLATCRSSFSPGKRNLA
jgi:hypothetical protein